MNLITISKKMCLLFMALSTLSVVTSCSEESSDGGENGSYETKSLTINLNSDTPVDWGATGDALLLYTGAKSEVSSMIYTEEMGISTTASFSGDMISSGGYDIVYGVYPSFSQGSLPDQLSYDISQQDASTTFVYALTPYDLGFEGEGETLDIDTHFMLPEVTFSLDLDFKDFSSEVTEIIILSSEIYTARYLNLTNETPYWQGGQKNAKITIAIDENVTFSADYDDQEPAQLDGTYTVTFKLKLFPQLISDMTIILMDETTDLYTTYIDRTIDLTDVMGDYSFDFDYSPSGTYGDSSFGESTLNGELEFEDVEDPYVDSDFADSMYDGEFEFTDADDIKD